MYAPRYVFGVFCGVMRQSDYASIPNDPANRDWQEFLLWYADQKPAPFTFDSLPTPKPIEAKPLPEIDAIVKGLTPEQTDQIVRYWLAEKLANDPKLAERAGVDIPVIKDEP